MFPKTKIIVPDAPFVFVEREEINAHLAKCTSYSLITLVAPAGYGKSATALHVLQSQSGGQDWPGAQGWLSLWAEDNNPVGFWRCLALAFCELDQEIMQPAYKLAMTVTQNSVTDLVHRLLADLEKLATKHSHIRLVIDDFHYIEDERVIAGFNQFIDALPNKIQLILTSRTQPALDLPHRRCKQQLLEITSQQLAFNAMEARHLLSRLIGHKIEERQLSRWLKQTEGWVAGFHLIGLQIQQSGMVNIREMNFVGEYVWDTVIGQLDDELKHFLRVTAHFPRFSAALCNALFERNDSAERMSRLYKNGFFIIPIDSNHQWYRYHDLFKNALREYGEPVENLARYRQRAARWFEKEGFFPELCEQLGQLKDWDWIIKITEALANDKTNYTNISLLGELLDALPFDRLQDRPKLLIIKSRSILSRGRYQEAPALLARAKQILLQFDAQAKDEDSWKRWSNPYGIENALEWNCLYGQLLMDQALLLRAFGQLNLAREHLEEARQRIPESAHTLLPRLYAGLALVHFEIGLEAQAQQFFEEAIYFCKQTENLEILAQALVFFGHLMLYRGKLKDCLRIINGIADWMEAKNFDVPSVYQLIRCASMDVTIERHAGDASLEPVQRYIENSRNFAEVATYCMHHMVLSQALYRAYIALKQYAEAERMIDAFETAQKRSGTRWNSPGCPSVDAMRAHLAFLKGEQAHAVHWAKSVLAQGVETQDFSRIMDRYIAVKILVHLQATELKLNDIYKIKKEATSSGRVYFLLKICLYEALFLYKTEQMSKAKSIMAHAMEIAESHDFHNAIVEEGAVFAPLLLWNQERSPAYHANLLNAMGVETETLQGNKTVDNGLSKAEMKLLTMLNSGLRYKEIALQQSISISTVKFHVNNIFKKLQVGSRTEALIKARHMKFIA